MKFYYFLILILIIVSIAIYAYLYEEPSEKIDLKEELSNMSISEFKKRWPKIDKKVFIEIRNTLKHYPDGITEDYIRKMLEDEINN